MSLRNPGIRVFNTESLVVFCNASFIILKTCSTQIKKLKLFCESGEEAQLLSTSPPLTTVINLLA